MTDTIEDVLADVSFPASRNALLTHATKSRATGNQLATLSALPDRTYIDRHDVTSAITGSPTPGRIRGALNALVAVSTGAVAVRTLVRQFARGSLGPVSLVMTAVQAAIAVRAATRAALRWRADRLLRDQKRRP